MTVPGGAATAAERADARDAAGAGDARWEALLRGPFYKMTGSGNDFVFFDARNAGIPAVVPPADVAALCTRGTGVGADGIVLLDQPGAARVRIAYYNSDGSRASLCGNATLCTARLAVEIGAVPATSDFVIATDAGDVTARAPMSGDPSFELGGVCDVVRDTSDALWEGTGTDEPASRVQEQRIGYAKAGVPHVVVRVADVDRVALDVRGRDLRRPQPDRPAGANVNFVSHDPQADLWCIRTFERGVEGETLACGTGAVATAAVLRAWEAAAGTVRLRTRSGRVLAVSWPRAGTATLAGEGRLVFVGRLAGLGRA